MVCDGKMFNAVIDTGAQVSILSRRMFQQLNFHQDITSKPVMLTGLNGDQKLRAELLKGLDFQLGRVKFKHDFYVCDISDDLLLGLDFIVKHQITVDMQIGMLVSSKAKIPFSLVRNGDVQYKTCRVEIKHTTVVPPESIVRTKVLLSGDHNEATTFVIPAIYDRGLLVPNVMVNGHKEAVIEIVNPTQNFHHFKKSHVLGLAEECEVVESQSLKKSDECESQKVRKAKAATNLDDNNAKCKAKNTSSTETTMPEHLKDLFESSTKHLSSEQAVEFGKVLKEFSDVFSKDDFDIGCYKDIQCRIDTQGAAPVKQNMRRTPLHFEREEEDHLDKMLKTGVIQPSSSDWASCPVLIRKKDGRVRWCIDYRKLNSVTRKDSFPLPRIEQCIDTLSGNVWFSTLDMTSGYWQIEIDPRDRHKTAFVTKYGLFEHVRMPFGLTNAPAIFQRVVQLLLRGMTWNQILAYLDDVIILGKSFDDHLANIRKVLERFRESNMKLKPKKCAFFQTELVYLGRLVTKEGVKVNPANVEKVKEWPTPTKVNDVEIFLGFLNYHRDHIKEYAHNTKPLYDLTRKGARFVWTEKEQSAFDKLKVIMTTLPTLSYPNLSLPFVLDTDASDTCIGAELLQYDPETGKEYVIGYGSYSLTPAQRKYCTTRKELLAIVRFTRHYRHYLLGRQFTVRTDHSSLTWLMRFRNINGMLARWIEELSQFDMVVQHRAGRKHGNADGLSRIPCVEDPCSEYQEGVPVTNLPCGGCKHCAKLHRDWNRFQDEVDYAVPLTARRSFALEVGRAPEEVRQIQLQDSVCAPLIKWLESKTDPEQHELMLASPAVKRFWRNRCQLRLVDGTLRYSYVEKHAEEERLLLILPSELKNEVLRNSHDIPSSGHVGIGKTFKKIASTFIWFRMRHDIKLYIETCCECNRNKKTNKKAKHALGRYHSSYPLEKVHIDLLGPFPTSHTGNNYILSIVDQFTKWVEIIPVKTQTSEEVAKAIVDGFITKFGCPIEIFTDQGSCFESQLFGELCEALAITKSRTTPYHPMSNGQVERFNTVILSMIRCTLGEDQENWDTKLQQLAMAIRSTVNRTTGFTPNYLMFGRENTLPVDFIAGTAFDNEKFDTHAEYVKTLVSSIEKAHETARKTILSSQIVQKRDYDIKLKATKYNVGDIVYRLNQKAKVGESNKLKEVYSGPYVVSKVLTPVVTQVQNQSKSLNLHNNNIKLCKDRKVPVWVTRLQNKILTGKENILDKNDLHLDKLFQEPRHKKQRSDQATTTPNINTKTQVDNSKQFQNSLKDSSESDTTKTKQPTKQDDTKYVTVPRPTKDVNDVDKHVTVDLDSRKLPKRSYCKKKVRFEDRVTRHGRKPRTPRYLSDFE